MQENNYNNSPNEKHTIPNNMNTNIPLKELISLEANLQYELNRVNAAMLKMGKDYKFVLVESNRRVAWIKI